MVIVALLMVSLSGPIIADTAATVTGILVFIIFLYLNYFIVLVNTINILFDLTGECGGHRFVDDSLVIDFASCSPLSVNADGYFYWQFTTEEDRIIAFSADSLAQFEPFVNVIPKFQSL